MKAVTTWGSNCAPENDFSSWVADATDIDFRYGRSDVIALNESATVMIRAPSGMSGPAIPVG